MTVQELIDALRIHQEYGAQDVFIHDEETGDDLPVGNVVERGGRRSKDGTHAVVLHVA